jgi:hypothetical protein
MGPMAAVLSPLLSMRDVPRPPRGFPTVRPSRIGPGYWHKGRADPGSGPDADTGKPIGPALTGHTGWIYSVAFSPDGHRIVFGSRDSTLRLWLTYPDPASAMCAKLITNVSHKQWNDWVSPDVDYVKVCPDPPGRAGQAPCRNPAVCRARSALVRVTGNAEPYSPGTALLTRLPGRGTSTSWVRRCR